MTNVNANQIPPTQREIAGGRRGVAPEDLEFMSDTSAAVLAKAPKGGRLILWMTVLFVVVAYMWASQAELDEVTRGQGKVIPSRHIQVIQNLEGGIVAEILVKEGDIVEQDQVLLRIDDTRFVASLEEDRSNYMALRAKAARLKAEAEGLPFRVPQEVRKAEPELVQQELKLYRSRKAQHERDYGLVLKELNMTKPLVAEGAISEVEVLRLERQVNEIKGEFRNSAKLEYNAVQAEISALAETLKASRDRVRRTQVRAPLRGTVKQLMVSTVGGVIRPGMDMLEIVPLDDTLRVEAQVRPADIGFLHPGQKAIVKFSAYDYAIYGGLDAVVDHISADTIIDERGDSFYLVRVQTDRSYLGTEQEPLPIIPGMVGTVEIMTGKKTILHYLLKPVLRAKERALRER